MRLLAMIGFCLFTASAAFADQCAWNKMSDAQSAKQLLTNNDAIFWCQNCHEKPSKIFRVTSIRVDRTSGVLTANVNGKSEPLQLDLAYVYVRTASDVFTNVSHLVGCPGVDGAMTFLKTGPGLKKTPHYYDARGEMQIGTAALNEDIRPWVGSVKKETDADRLPASK